ncbi:protein NRT1/ PTR FAMILY 6.3-like [Musa acuminata AAA Group]|uniref:protein NRT1/ PTR FAMILY 6.3-like n=1 Tax=Musa acuminata AAA Group TaxID=214697 RepID=UPI0031DAFAA2
MEIVVLPETAGEERPLSDAWDSKGRPAIKSRTGGWVCAATSLVVEMGERLATLSIAVNLGPYLRGTMHLGGADSANIITNFLGTSFILCLFGGFIADTFLGRYLTIAVFTAVQACGVIILTISTVAPGLRPPACAGPSSGGCVPANGLQMGMLYLGLFTTALGTGGLKSSVSGFGSDQFDESDRIEKKQMMKFFRYFFFFINVGSILAVTVMVYIQDHFGRRWGYGICAVAIIAGLALFLSKTNRYRFKKLVGSPLTQFAAVVACAWRKRRLALPEDPSILYDIDTGVARKGKSKKEKVPHSQQFRFLDRAAIIEGDAPAEQSKWRLSTLTDVEEVKQVIRMLPTWATTIMFWTVYAQMTTFSVSQATTMDRHIGPSFEIPAGSLTVFFVGSILVTVPFYDRIVVPVTRRITGNPQGLSSLRRIAVGLVFSILGMCAASLTERKRLSTALANPTAAVVPLVVFWLIPQFFLVGAGVAFMYIGQLDFFLRECPKGMKTMSTGLFLSTLSLGFFLSTALVTIVHKVTGSGGKGAWLTDDLNKGKLYNFYWLLVALSTLNLVAFVAASRGYVYKETRTSVDDAQGVELEQQA